MRKPMEFWVVIEKGKYPSVLYVHWAAYRSGEVLGWAHEAYPKIERGSLQAIKVREVRRAGPRKERKR